MILRTHLGPRPMLVFALSVALLGVGSTASARSFRLTEIPSRELSCATCHVSNTNYSRNPFGTEMEYNYLIGDILSSASVDWTGICSLDSDGDGASNGLELKDPNCTWVFGDTQTTGVYGPGDATSTPVIPDAGVVDMGPVDTGVVDGGRGDTGAPDSGPDLGVDAGLVPDAGTPLDAGVIADTGPLVDASPGDVEVGVDAGPLVDGSVDAGAADGGTSPVDAGEEAAKVISGGCRGTEGSPSALFSLVLLGAGICAFRRRNQPIGATRP